MRQTLVMGNWKLHGDTAFVKDLIAGIVEKTQGAKAEVAVCPPFVYVPVAHQARAGSHVKLGAQNVATQVSGAFTGEVAAPMLKDVGCEYVIIGHSERRQYYGDTDEVVAQKVAQAIEAGLAPVLCIGESQQERENGTTEHVVQTQLQAALKGLSAAQLKDLVVAYEPVWAIGTGLTATPEQAQAVHAFLRGLLAKISPEVAQQTRILYGGSMKPGNAAELLSQRDIDGGLIGGASLKAEDFAGIALAS